jgi:hypothetical protein
MVINPVEIAAILKSANGNRVEQMQLPMNKAPPHPLGMVNYSIF